MEAKVIIVNPLGLHARAAAKFVKTLSQFPQTTMSVQCGQRIVSGDSLMSLMMLSAKIGSEVIIKAQGSDAEQALAAIVNLIQKGFGEI